MKKEPFILERVFAAPVSQIWEAITDKDRMRQWYFEIEEFKAIVGFEFQFYGGNDEKKYLHVCKITEVIPGKKLSYSWRYEGYPGESLLSFELFPEGDATRLKLMHSGLNGFPADNPDFAQENFEAGWNYILGTSLKNFLEKSSLTAM